MVRKAALTVFLMASCVWCLALARSADSAQPAAKESYKPVASVPALMQGQKTFFKGIAEGLKQPANADRNHELETAAQLLAELANVNRYTTDNRAYTTWATELRDTALLMAAEAKKADGVDEARIGKLLQTAKESCVACHDAHQ